METIKTQVKNRFMQICIGISMVTLSIGFLVLSINHATATPDRFPHPNDFMAQGGGKIGKYACSMCTVPGYKNNAGQTFPISLEAVVIDTETGKSVCYGATADNWKWMKDPNQIPANPFQ